MKVTCKQQKAHAIKRDKDEISTSSGDEYAMEGVNKLSTGTEIEGLIQFDISS